MPFMDNKDEEAAGRGVLLELPQELFPKILAHLNVGFVKRLMRSHSCLHRGLRSNLSLWRHFASDSHTCIRECMDEIRHKHTLRRSICRLRNEVVVDFETCQADVTFMQMGKDRVACSSDDQTVKVFGLDGRLVKTFIGHKGGVWTFMMNDSHLVTGSTDKTARIWDIRTGCTSSVLMGHKSTVRSLRICGEYIATGSRDSEIRIWNFRGMCLGVLKGHMQSVRCMDMDGEHLLSGSYDGTVALWDYRKGRLLRHLKPHTLRVYSVALSRSHAASSGLDSHVHVSALGGRLVCSYKAHRSLVVWLRFVDNRYLLSSGADGVLCKWDIREDRQVYRIEEAKPIIAQGVIGDLLVVSTSKEVNVYDLRGGAFIRTLFASPSSLISKVEVAGRCISVAYFKAGVCRVALFSY